MNVIKVSELEDVIFYEYLQDFIKDLARRQSIKFITNNGLKLQIQDLKNQVRHKDIALDSYPPEIDNLKELLRKVVCTFSNNTRNEDLLIQDIMKVIK